MERRSLFERIFGRPRDKQGFTKYELINSPNSTYWSWNGNLMNSDIVRAAIRPKVNAVGKLNAKHIKGEGPGMKVNPEGWLKELLQNPNPHMTMQDFLAKMVWQLELNANAFAYVEKDPEGWAVGIWPLPAQSVELLEHRGEVWTRFQFLGGKSIAVPYTDIIHLRKDFCSDDFFGSTGQLALTNVMEVINTTDQGIVNAIKNSAVIRWLLKFQNILRTDDVAAQVAKFKADYLSIDANAGVAATDPRFDAVQVKNDNVYTPAAEQMQESIKRLYAYFGVNEKIVTNSFNEDEWLAFYEAEIENLLIKLSNAFTNALFTVRERGRGNRVIFEGVNLAYASMKTKLELVGLVDRGIITPNEHRRILNLPPIEGGDTPIRRLDTVPIDDKPAPTAKVDGGGEIDNEG